ncbi:HpcH/HpaI aldolase/citrate lyase family protein [Sphingomonas cavernae]|uniref:CoA ester lyase n=1 Tax=Sphingomonas cavernae TaxID=2320861 RepID=A0A418W604_9SPHN|nr:CoA ester lyase [Sphingomonas cavernae]RJF85357.1 CoA ester lyase [Sphingomonas cavernae]
MRLRSLLFVPGDRPDRMEKAAVASGADALILDLEDAVALTQKDVARTEIGKFLQRDRQLPVFVRVNPLDSGMTDEDLAAVLPGKPDGIVLPKAEGRTSLKDLDSKLDWAGAQDVVILPIATETAAAMFQLGSYGGVTNRLIGLTWGAEDLPAAIGAVTSREDDGSYTAPYQVARSLTLFGAHAAGVQAIETVYPAFKDLDGLAVYAARGRRDGFTGMMAIHPTQVPVINAAFTPSEAEIEHARSVIAAFAANPQAGALSLDGRMIDRPHVKQAERILAAAGE